MAAARVQYVTAHRTHSVWGSVNAHYLDDHVHSSTRSGNRSSTAAAAAAATAATAAAVPDPFHSPHTHGDAHRSYWRLMSCGARAHTHTHTTDANTHTHTHTHAHTHARAHPHTRPHARAHAHTSVQLSWGRRDNDFTGNVLNGSGGIASDGRGGGSDGCAKPGLTCPSTFSRACRTPRRRLV